MILVSLQRHGVMTGVMKSAIDWTALAPIGGIRAAQGKVLVVAQVSGGSQNFNAVNQTRILGRWMWVLTIPNHSSVPKVR